MNNECTIRMASAADATALLEIYRPYVEQTAITFEYNVPSIEEFTRRITHTLKKYPYLVAERDRAIVGYAYASPFKERAAYDWAVEVSIYLRQGCGRHGCGTRLYGALETLLRAQHITNLNACIACTEQEDAHLTNGSVAFHSRLGYRMVGTFRQCGFKFGTWYDMCWMEKQIGEHPANPAPVLPAGKLDWEALLH